MAVAGHVLSPLATARRVADLIEIVALPALKSNMDVVNFIGTRRDAHNPRSVTHELFDVLGAHTVVAHAKDCALSDGLVVHIDEVAPGTGTLDHELVLRRFAACCPEGYVLIEHLPDEQIPAARRAICQPAERAEVKLES